MFLAFYNPNHVGDILLLVRKETSQPVESETKGDITRVFDQESNETLAYNLANASQYLKLEGNGQVFLSEEDVKTLNHLLVDAGFAPAGVDNSPKFVIGKVLTCVDHPDSDHLHVTTVDVGDGQVEQIVCGAPNVAEGQLVVVAKVGAVMPSGLIIYPGELRGETSNGMLCSARELGLPHDGKRGILVLEEGTVGQPFGELA